LGSAVLLDPVAERGKYLASAGNCVSCHTRSRGAPFSGGVPFETPFGTIYSSNITPDRDTGIGKWTQDDLRRAMQQGIAAGGYYLFPAFPYTAFTKVTDQDVDAIYAYLRTLKPARYRPPSNGSLFTLRWGMAVWNALYFKPGRFRADPTRPAEWNRGAYLVEGLAHCSACHSPRNWAMAEETDRAYSGGIMSHAVAPGKIRRWSAINLTDTKRGLASWSIDDVAKYLSTGVSRRAGTFGPMNDVIANSLMYLKPEDVHAIAVYLKSLPPRESPATELTAAQAHAGAAVYKARCEKCHMASGRGGIFNGPPLAGSAVTQADDPASLINIVLYGAQTPQDIRLGVWETMKPYFDVLTDAEIADVANYIRGSWENHAPPVTPGDASRQR